jgi:hypothetical protein
MATWRVNMPQINVAAKRGFAVEITDASWAQEELEKMGVKLKHDPPKELEVMEADWLENPDEKIVKLVDEVLAFNAIEMCQFQRRMQVSSIFNFLLAFIAMAYRYIFTILFFYSVAWA